MPKNMRRVYFNPTKSKPKEYTEQWNKVTHQHPTPGRMVFLIGWPLPVFRCQQHKQPHITLSDFTIYKTDNYKNFSTDNAEVFRIFELVVSLGVSI
jgi:hypothetical protein